MGDRIHPRHFVPHLHPLLPCPLQLRRLFPLPWPVCHQDRDGIGDGILMGESRGSGQDDVRVGITVSLEKVK